MRALCLFALIILAALSAFPQTAEPSRSDGLQVLSHRWEKLRINWEGDPLAAPVEGYSEMRTRVGTERRTRSALEVRQNQDQKKEEKKAGPPPRYIFSYKIEVLNTSKEAVREIDWDYIFIDASTGAELGRREFTSTETVGPGKKKSLIVRVSSPPTQQISIHSLGKSEREGLNERIVIVNVRYEAPRVEKP